VRGDGGNEFCYASGGNILVVVNNLEIKLCEAGNLGVRRRMVVEEFIGALYAMDNEVYLGGEVTELLSLSLAEEWKIKTHLGFSDNGVAKIMSINKLAGGNRKLLVVSIEQNISVLRICNHHHFELEGVIVGYND
jgi:hypothetical protein